MEFNPTTTKFTTLYPNPASSKVNIDFYLDQASDITLEVYNVTGQKVYTSTATHVDAGFNFTNLAVDDFTNGVYIVKLLQGQNVVDVRMLSVTK